MFELEGIGQVLLRMVLIFAAALIVVRMMGNRAVGQLSPFDFVLMVGIGDIVANVALARDESLLPGVEGLIGLLILQQVLGMLSLKNLTLRKWFEGTPVTVIEDGKILRENCVKLHFNYDDLRQELHKLGMDMSNLKDIKLARLESCGDFTVVKVPEAEPLSKREFENYIKDIYNNPLSPVGEQWTKVEQLIEDVRFLTEYIKQHQNSMKSAGTSKIPNE